MAAYVQAAACFVQLKGAFVQRRLLFLWGWGERRIFAALSRTPSQKNEKTRQHPRLLLAFSYLCRFARSVLPAFCLTSTRTRKNSWRRRWTFRHEFFFFLLMLQRLRSVGLLRAVGLDLGLRFGSDRLLLGLHEIALVDCCHGDACCKFAGVDGGACADFELHVVGLTV